MVYSTVLVEFGEYIQINGAKDDLCREKEAYRDAHCHVFGWR